MGGHEGWDSELFVDPPDDSDLCGICCEVLDDAVETPCGHPFCEKCIRGWLQQREVCPQDQTPLKWADCRPMVRDRRRILGLKVKCPFDECGEQMELRQLREHQKNCQHKPDDWVDPREGDEPAADEEPLTPVKAQEEKQEPAAKPEEPEFVIEMNPDPFEAKPDGKGDGKMAAAAAANANNNRHNADQEEKDRLFALQMQQQEQARGRNLSRQPSPVQKKSVAVSPVQVVVHQPQALELAPADDGYYYQAGADGRKEGEGVGAGVDGGEILRPPKKTRCCNDKVWCCFCCVFWIVLLVIGGFILIKGGISGAKSALSP
jgi:hypothetical protein